MRIGGFPVFRCETVRRVRTACCTSMSVVVVSFKESGVMPDHLIIRKVNEGILINNTKLLLSQIIYNVALRFDQLVIHNLLRLEGNKANASKLFTSIR